MPLSCGPNQFTGSVVRHGDAQDAVSAYDLAESLAIAAAKVAVRDFVNVQVCPAPACPNRQYDPSSLRIRVRRVWGGPSPDYPGLYRIVARADYSFVIVCGPAVAPVVPDQPPQPALVPDLDADAYFRYCLEVACCHFCTFKAGGSTMKYVHVHITLPLIIGYPPMPDAITGIGHDDETNPNHPRHNTVSYGDGRCGFETNPTSTTIFPGDRGVRVEFDIYFIECGPEGCPDGWKRHECPCGCMCWTLSHEVWEQWYRAQ